ncbi:hypothetical protein V6N11_054447 [Hibiscus sabdariffa]|uniref:DUF4378 domain-containing protein n=1 Tax=Hibiscus sabdariffa TaxID=183260 RepID=A0ABR2S4U3_9ROSI
MEVLQRFEIGWCKSLITNIALATEMKEAAVMEEHVMGITRNMSWKKETFERIASLCGLAICVEDETLEPSSSGRGRVLIESTSLDRIEDRIEWMVMDSSLLVRVLEAEIFLQGLLCDLVNVDSDVGNSYEEHGEARSDDDASFKGPSDLPTTGVGSGEAFSLW